MVMVDPVRAVSQSVSQHKTPFSHHLHVISCPARIFANAAAKSGLDPIGSDHASLSIHYFAA